MRSLLEFKEYLNNGVVKQQKADIPRARFLIQESEKSFIGFKRRINNEKIDEFSTNSIVKDAHDIIIESIRAKMLLDGFSASGNNAHEAEVAYTRELGFQDGETDFINELRFVRNSILYYGKIMSVDYTKKVAEFLDYIYPKLKKLCIIT